MDQLSQGTNVSTQSTQPASENQNPFSSSSNEGASQDQDMRTPLNPTKSADLLNQDIDMRILPPIVPLERSEYKKSDKDESAAKREFMSKYLQDAYINAPMGKKTKCEQFCIVGN